MSRFKPGHDVGKAHRWKPGQSGNPNGRKPKPSLVAAIERQLRRNEDEGDGPTVDDIAKRLIAMADKGDPASLAAIREVIDRVDGKAIAKHEISGPDGEAIKVDANEVLRRLVPEFDTGDESPPDSQHNG